MNWNYLYLIPLLGPSKARDVSDFGPQLIIYHPHFFLILSNTLLLYFFYIYKRVTIAQILLSRLAPMILEFSLLFCKRFTSSTKQFHKVVLLYHLLKLENHWQIFLYQLEQTNVGQFSMK